jgi:hypothetical protein
LSARQTLSQLSYGPTKLHKCSRELVVTSPVDTDSLVVETWRQTQLKRRPTNRHFMWEEITPPCLCAIGSDRVDLVGLILPMNQTLPPTSAPTGSDGDDVAVPNSPLALNPEKLRAYVQDQVVALVTKRPKHTDSNLECLERDSLLCKHALLIGRQHRQQRYC